MPTYTVQAPNGKTYSVEGPQGATEDQVRAEVLRQNPEAAGAPDTGGNQPTTVDPVTVTAKPATFLSTLGRAAYNLPRDTFDTAKGIIGLPDAALRAGVHAVAHPVQTASDVADWVGHAADILGGGAQRAADMLPGGTLQTPKMDTSAFDQFAQGIHDKYLTKQGIYKQIGDHPLGTLLTVGSVAMPALKAVGATDAIASALGGAADAAGATVKAPISDIASRVQNVAGAGTRANAAAETMRSAARTSLESDAAAQAAAQAAAAAQAKDAAAGARRSQTMALTLDARSKAAAAAATPPTPDIGTPAHLSDIGDAIRQPAVAQQDAINSAMREADTQYRSAMDQVAADRAAAGVGVSDTDAAKQLITKAQGLMNPDPATRATVGSIPADSAGGKLYNMALDVLQPKTLPLTPEQAAQAKAAGIEVQQAKDGSFYRTVKPDLKAVDDYRRFLGKVLDGKVEGYEAVNRIEAGQLYGDVSKVIDEYVGGASKPVQQNWAAGKKALEPFEKVRAGQAVVGTQPGTDVASVPASSIPGRLVAGGRDTVRQTAAVAGQGPVSAALRSQVQNAFAGAKNADAMAALIRPGTQLGDAVAAEPDLAAAVNDYLNRARTAEASGAQAEALAGRSAAANKRADTYSKMADTLTGNAAKADEAARETQRQLSLLEIADPKDVGAHYKAMLDRAYANRTISIDQYEAGQKLALSAERDFKLKATRDNWLKGAAGALGVGALSAKGVGLLHAGGH